MRSLCTIAVLVGCCGLIGGSTVPASAQGARIWLSPATLDLAPGELGTVEIRVENVANLAGAEVNLTFDSAVVEIVDADPAIDGTQIAHGDFLSPDFVAQNLVDPTSGTVQYAIACMPVDNAPTGSGELASVTFRAVAEGKTLVTISSALLADADV